ncbi:MAG: hypothetical protein ACLFQK_06815 [Fibrobacterota bacterium]
MRINKTAVLGAALLISGFAASASFPEYLLSIGEDEWAGYEYRREIAEGGDSNIMLKAAALFFSMGKNQYSSELAEDMISDRTLSEERRIEAHFLLIKNKIKTADFNTAEYEINKVSEYSVSEKHKGRIEFLRLLNAARSYDFQSAESSAEKLVNNGPEPYRKKAALIKKEISDYKKKEFKNPKLAAAFSSRFPGLGHLYAGRKKQSLQAFTLVGGLSAFMVWTGYKFVKYDNRDYRYVLGMDFIAFGAFVWHRYYRGIENTAVEGAVMHNQKIQSKYQKRLLETGGL